MNPFIIGVGGDKSGAGKTSLVCRLLQSLKGWGAVKCTPTPLYSAVIDDIETLAQKDKDTARFLEAGAEEVIWVQSTKEDLEETLRIAVDRLSHLKGVIVEGNSAIEVLMPDIVIFIFKGESEGLKESAKNTLKMADLVIYKKEPSIKTPANVRKFHIEDKDGYLNYIRGIIDGKA
jgi:molybdopterin-guanine dinucleotide biosynthesis protein